MLKGIFGKPIFLKKQKQKQKKTNQKNPTTTTITSEWKITEEP